MSAGFQRLRRRPAAGSQRRRANPSANRVRGSGNRWSTTGKSRRCGSSSSIPIRGSGPVRRQERYSASGSASPFQNTTPINIGGTEYIPTATDQLSAFQSNWIYESSSSTPRRIQRIGWLWHFSIGGVNSLRRHGCDDGNSRQVDCTVRSRTGRHHPGGRSRIRMATARRKPVTSAATSIISTSI